jgi:hypothetical protein
MAMRRTSFAALRVARRTLVFGRASSQNQKGSTHFHRAPALRKFIDLKLGGIHEGQMALFFYRNLVEAP